MGAAHGFLPGQEPLAAADFSGGAATVGRLLSGLGFQVTQAVSGLTAGDWSSCSPRSGCTGRRPAARRSTSRWPCYGRSTGAPGPCADGGMERKRRPRLASSSKVTGNIHGRSIQSRRCTTLACGISAVRGRCDPRTAMCR